MNRSATPSLRVVPADPSGQVVEPDDIPRARALARLLASTQRVVHVSAPAGSGKSTLAAQWAAADVRTCAVLQLAPVHDDAAGLVEAVVVALGEIGPRTARAPGHLAVGPDALETTALPLVAGLTSGRRAPFLLIVDGIHLLHAPACHRVLRTVAESVPEGSQLALLSRGPAPEWLGRMRAEGEVLDLGAHNLAFDVPEARQLLGALGRPEDVAEALVEESEGWAAGLALLARSDAQDAEDGTDVARHVADYVRSELLSGVGPDDAHFLLRASVLDLLASDACDSLLERTDSASALARLHDLHLVVAGDGERRSYRCNRLVARVLRDDLESRDPAGAADLHRRAASWFGARGDVDTAVHHAKAAHDHRLVGELVWSGMVQCIGIGRPDLLVARLDGIDDVDLAGDRWLALATAWAKLQTGQRDAVERWMRVAERHAGRDWRERAAQDDYAASVAYLVAVAGHESLAASIDLCVSARAGLPPDSPFHPSVSFVEGVSRTLLREGATGLELLRAAERSARTLSVPIIEANSLCWQGIVLIQAGDAPRGARTILSSVDLFRTQGLERLASSAISLSAQSLALALLHDRSAADVLSRARQTAASVLQVSPWVDVMCRMMQARAAVALGNGALARNLLGEARSFMTAELHDSLASDMAAEVERALRMLSVEGISGASLTAAEMRVLQFLPSHLTFPQIGEHLFLTANTVKTHAHSIYRKLAVTSRDDAVLRAQSLGLLDGGRDD